jgi:hypothetical protein
MTKPVTMRAILAVIMFVFGSLQAWDSDVPVAGLLIVFLVSLAIALPPVALLVPLNTPIYLATFAISLILLVIARVISPTPLPGLFLVLIPGYLGLIFTRMINPGNGNARTPDPPNPDI